MDGASFAFGTDFITFFTSIFTKNLEFSYFNVFMLFNIIGALGLIAFDSSLKCVMYKKTVNLKYFFIGNLAFLPSISFWSSALGKDAISFLAVGLALWASLYLRKRWWLMLISILLMLLVRPHISGLMVISLSLVLLFRKNGISGIKKILLLFAVLAGAIFSVSFALEYSGLYNDISLESINYYFETRQGYNQEGSGGIDISQMSLPSQLFTYIFRPLPFEAQGFAAFAASFENVLLIILFIYAIYCFIFKINNKYFYFSNNLFIFIYAPITWIILAMTTANLGISLRQKWMFLPMLLYLAVSVIVAANPASSKK